MAKILISPSKYLQGAGEMKKIGTYALLRVPVRWFLIILTENVATVKSTVW